MTPKKVSWIFISLASTVIIHLLSYNIKFIFPEHLIKHWYWILNSLTHMGYTVTITLFASANLKKNPCREFKIMVLFLEDWICLLAIDVYNQFNDHYNINPVPQWIAFILVLAFQIIRYKKWLLTYNKNRL